MLTSAEMGEEMEWQDTGGRHTFNPTHILILTQKLKHMHKRKHTHTHPNTHTDTLASFDL